MKNAQIVRYVVSNALLLQDDHATMQKQYLKQSYKLRKQDKND